MEDILVSQKIIIYLFFNNGIKIRKLLKYLILKKKYVKVLSSENSDNFRHPRIIDDGENLKILYSKTKKKMKNGFIFMT